MARVLVHHRALYLNVNAVVHPEHRGSAVHIAIGNDSKPKVTLLPITCPPGILHEHIHVSM
jgi:hypothetical protein